MRRLALIVLVMALVPAPAALADAYQSVESIYSKSGSVPACRFSSSTLAAALREAPTYDLEYDNTAPAIQLALHQRAAGQCASHRSAAALRAVPGLGSPPAARLPGSPTDATGAGAPLPLLLALIAALVAAAAAGALLVVRRLGFAPAWTESAGHSWAEAEDRLTEAWAGVRDRLGDS